MTREILINYGYAIAIQQLVKDLPNDMELGKAVRTLTDKVNTQINRLQMEGIPKPPVGPANRLTKMA